MKKSLLVCFGLLAGLTAGAQRTMERLDRGLVAVKVSGGVYASWRILGEEYYDTQYNLYRDGVKVNDDPLDVSNYRDTGGTASSVYTVRAVVRGEEQADSRAAAVWGQQYLSVPMGRVYSRRGTDITERYVLNDVSTADLDGDGEFELIVKRINAYDDNDLYPEANDSAFVFFEAYKLDGTKLWQIDCGPNMVSGSNVEINLVAYDWDGDGKAELLMRAADGTILSDGTVIGDITKNYRWAVSHTANMTYMTAGDEFLLYMEGATGKLYNQRPFPLKRLEDGESSVEAAWGDGYGHRCNKFFFGAPYLDGRKPSLFLARGIYTRHKMVAFDVDPATHELTERWRWNCNTGGPWYGQGYHNYGIADVDGDGRDEIVYGSMVIDDTGRGLSTTGLGHGDAQHCGDLDPYRPGLEIFACNEDAQGANYRDATTSQIYYWHSLGRDCGRCMAGNFTDQYLGSQLVAVGTGLVSSVTGKAVADTYTGITQDYRIYWDGDLCSESLDGVGTEGPAAVYKFGQSSPIFTAAGTKMNNWTKNTPALQADILGDWREELVLRSEDNMELRVYTTTTATPWRNYTLLHDMQYRQAVCWQMCGYNQPPHVSYFLGQAEGITVAPPPVMTNGREEIADGRITAAGNGKHLLLADPEGGVVTLDGTVAPYILTVNAFSHTEGHNNNDNITTTQSTYTIEGGRLTGEMRLVKQGGGILSLTGTHDYTGETRLWDGIVNFSGSLPASPVWMNRFAELNAAGTLGGGLTAEYGSVLRVGGEGVQGTLTVTDYTMNFGAAAEFDLFADGTADVLTVSGTLTLKQLANAANGPQYAAPVFRFVAHNVPGSTRPEAGRYLLVKAGEVSGDLSAVTIEGLPGVSCRLEQEGEGIYLVVDALRAPTTIYWNGGAEGGLWDLNSCTNFSNAGEADVFVTGDKVVFDDAAQNFTVNVSGDVEPDTALFAATQAYVLQGSGQVSGTASLTKEGSGRLSVLNTNNYTGKTTLAGGTTVVSALANEQTQTGALGAYTTAADRFEIRNGAVLQTTGNVTMGTPLRIGAGGGTINNGGAFDMKAQLTGDTLTKAGAGTLTLYTNNALKATVVTAGTLAMAADGIGVGDPLILEGGTYQDCDNSYSYSNNAVNFRVPAGKKATLNLDSRCTYRGKLTGAGTVSVNVPWVRTQLQGDWSGFEGTLKPTNTGNGLTLDNAYGLPKATLDLSAGVTVTNSGKTFRIGKVLGSGTLGTLPPWASSGTNTWEVGSLDADFTFAGSVTGTGTALNKVGTGTMKLTGTSDFTGTCTLQGGAVCLDNKTAAKPMLGTGALRVMNGATLCGQGLLGNIVTVSAGGTVRPGVLETSMSGTIDFGGKNVNFAANSVLRFYVRSNKMYTNVTNIGTLRMQGTVKVDVYDGLTLAEGTELTLWTADSYSATATAKLKLASPGEGREWDVSDIEKGILRVVLATGISQIPQDEEVDCTVCTLGGVSVARFTCVNRDIQNALNAAALPKGTYIVTAQGAAGSGSKKYLKK